MVIFDLVKNKHHRVYKTNAVTALCWSDDGEMLFAGKIRYYYGKPYGHELMLVLGTRHGEVLSLGIDKQFCTAVWNATSELLDSTVVDDLVTMVRKVTWMSPQPPSSHGCLFVLLGINPYQMCFLR